MKNKIQEPIHVLQWGMMTGGGIGGIDVFVMNMYRNIDRNRIQFDFLTFENMPKLYFEDEINKLGGKVYRSIAPNRAKHPIRYFKTLVQFFESHPEIQAVHYNIGSLVSIDLLIIAWLEKVPLRIVHSHSVGSDYDKKWGRKILHKLNRKIVKFFVTNMYACSKSAGIHMFGKNSQFEVIPNAIDAQKYKYSKKNRNKVREWLNISEDTILLGSVGRLEHEKNPEFMIMLMSYIVKKNSAFQLIMCGDGPLKAKLQQMIKEYKLENHIKLLGNRNDVFELMSAMDIFLLTSFHEGFSIVLLEAQANGLPCVVSSVMVEEVMINQNIKKCSLEHDYEEWYQTILEMLRYKDRNLQEQSDTIYKSYDIHNRAKDMERKYLDLIQQNRKIKDNCY